MTADCLTDEDAIFEERRRVLMQQVEEFCARTGKSRTALSLAIFHDGNAIGQFEGGRRMKLATFQKAMTWFDENPQGQSAAPSLASAGT